MAAKKKAAKKTFPKTQGVEGEGDRFIPPDRQDQLTADPLDRAQVVEIKDLGENIEILEGGEELGEEEGADAPAKKARAQEPDRDDDDQDEDGARVRGRRSRERDDDDEDDRSYSRRVRARINRERALRQQADSRVEHAERRARQVEERLAKLERVTAEVKENTSVKALEAEIAQLDADIKAALEADDHKRAFDLQARLGDKKADLRELKRDLEATRKQQIADEEKRKQEDETLKTGGAGDKTLSENTIDWKEANRGWFTRARYKDAREDAIQLDLEIQKAITAGEHDFEMYSEEHFELLNEQLAELYPELPLFSLDGTEYPGIDRAGSRILDDEEDRNMNRDRGGDRRDRDRRASSQNTRRAPVGRGTQRNGRREQNQSDLARQGKVQLSEGDFQQMRLYGLDPKNAEHKKRFARERMRSILTEERRGERS